MSETQQLVRTAKRLLKAQGLTYRDIAPALKLSEASVKRLFASGRFTLERLVEVGKLLGYTLAELAQEAEASSGRVHTLTEAQEREVLASTKLLLVAACVLNHWALPDIVAAYRLKETEVLQCLVKLDRLRLIDLLPGNRIRLNVARDFEWRPDGPIQRHFRKHWQADFLGGSFDQEDELASFMHSKLTEQALEKMRQEVTRLRQRFTELHEESLAAPIGKRFGMGLIIGMRAWEPQEFAALRREPPPSR